MSPSERTTDEIQIDSPSLHIPKQVVASNRRKLPFSMTKKDKTKISVNLRSELQGLIAVLALDQLMQGGDLKIAQQQIELRDFFHGDRKKGLISHVSMLAKGEEMFASLFEQDPDMSTEKRLRKLFYPSYASMLLGKNINQEVLETSKFSTKSLVSGRQLYNRVTECLKNCRKALSILPKHLDMKTGMPLHSGHSVEDVAQSVLDAMWVMEKEILPEERSGSSPNEEEEEDEITDKSTGASGDVRPTEWVFRGYMSFMFFGPFKENFEEKRALAILNIKDPPGQDKKQNSRSASRMKAAAKEKAIRVTDLSRGTTKQETQIDRQLKVKQEEVKGKFLIMSNEVILQYREGLRKDLDGLRKDRELLSRNMKDWREFLLQYPDNELMEEEYNMFKEEYKKFEQEFWSLWEALKKSNHNREKNMVGRGKKRLILDLTGDSDTEPTTTDEGYNQYTPIKNIALD